MRTAFNNPPKKVDITAMKRVLAFTSNRADYEIMEPVYSVFKNHAEIDLKLIVSGAHLSSTYGYSLDQITRDGYSILLTIETLFDSNTNKARLKSGALFLLEALEPVSAYNPDIILFAGDREDTIMIALLAAFLEIPSIHFFGGDHATDGHIDNPVRHSASKLATAHFVTLDQHRERLLKLGESPERIFVIGNPALDRFVQHTPIAKPMLRTKMGINDGFENFALLIFHPLMSEADHAGEYFETILLSLLEKGIDIFISTPNTDAGNKHILAVIERYRDNPHIVFFKNLERELFISIYKNALFIIGNSSSGILESASIPLPAINVGERQRGRFAEKNVLFCPPEKESILMAIDTALNMELSMLVNPYGDGKSAQKALDLILNTDFSSLQSKSEDPLYV